MILLILAGGVAVGLSGCQNTPPGPGEINTQFHYLLQQLQELVRRAKEQCNNDPECIAGWTTWYQARLAELLQAQTEAINENWDDAYKRREEWEKKIRDMFPGWPDVKDIVPWERNSIVTVDLQTSAFGVPTGSSLVVPPPEEWTTDVGVSGTASLSYEGSTASLTITGTLTVSGDTYSDGRIAAHVYSGSLTATDSVLGIATTFSVAPLTDATPPYAVNIDAAGNGTVDIVFTRYIPDAAWNAVVPGFIRLQLPIVRAPDGSASLTATNTRLGDIMPNTPWEVTDYNKDGLRTYTTDYAAFMAGLSSQEVRADVNLDGQWNSADITAWNALFNDDANR